jgi:hypothetical protein
MPGLVPGIHDFLAASKQGVDGRDKPGHDDFVSDRLFAHISKKAKPGAKPAFAAFGGASD